MLKNKKELAIAVTLALATLAGVTVFASQSNNHTDAEKKKTTGSLTTVTITDQQAKQVSITPVQSYDFAEQSEAVGYIDFNQDNTVQVFAPYQGRIRQVLVKAGDDVNKGQPLFSIDSPDLVIAESNLITTAGIMNLTSKVLERAKKMLETQSVAQKDVDQATSDQQAAEANYRAARDAVRIFGKSDTEIDKILNSRKVDGELIVSSPMRGKVTARNAAPGLLLQPGSQPAPLTISDLSSVWMTANVSEYDLPKLRLGQDVKVSVMAYPGQQFFGKINNIGVAVDPTTHRIAVRSEIKDTQHILHPQMLATYRIRVGEPVHSVAIPINAIVRENNGTMTVFVTQDGHTFIRRNVKLGTEQDGRKQILEGVSAGEKIASDGAIFLSNMLALQSR